MTNSADLASEVTGSLSNASSLANNLGKWLAIAVLVAAFLLASLLTMAAVSRRVREFGTLKALGWKSRRIIGQVMGEAVTMGIIGGADRRRPRPGRRGAGDQDVAQAHRRGRADHRDGHAGRRPPVRRLPRRRQRHRRDRHLRRWRREAVAAGGFANAFRNASTASHTVAVHLAASVSSNVILLAVVLAVAGGIIAGTFGGWRAARLRPAAALSKVA